MIKSHGIPVTEVNKVTEGRPHIVDMIKNGDVSFIVNTVEETRTAVSDSRSIRTTALARRVTYYTTVAGAKAACAGMKHLAQLEPYRLQDLHARLRQTSPEAGSFMKTPMTRRGAELLREELHRLKTIERPANSQAIGEARAHGDLSENAEYHAARERAGFIEGRISELEAKLANAQVIDPKLVDADGRCVFGATVDVEDEAGEKSTWQIVGEDEADIKKQRISVSSPMARALIGKESGERVDVQTPGGVKRYEIVDVRYE